MEQTRSFRNRHPWLGLTAAGMTGALLAGGSLVLADTARAGWRRAPHPHWGHADLANPEHAAERAAHVVDWVLRAVDGSESQRAAAAEIAEAAAADLASLAERHRENHEDWRLLLGAERIDRAALEALRVEEMALAEEASRRLLAAVADLAELLTPAQRGELLEWSRVFQR